MAFQLTTAHKERKRTNLKMFPHKSRVHVRWGNMICIDKRKENKKKRCKKACTKKKGEKGERERRLIRSGAGLARGDKTSHNAAQS